MDGLRTRVEFLGSLPRARKDAFLSRVEAGLASHIRASESDCRRTRKQGSAAEHLAARGALLMLRARRAWLREVRAARD
jgi:hypothetical protein